MAAGLPLTTPIIARLFALSALFGDRDHRLRVPICASTGADGRHRSLSAAPGLKRARVTLHNGQVDRDPFAPLIPGISHSGDGTDAAMMAAFDPISPQPDIPRMMRRGLPRCRWNHESSL
jgi:hypothetical protein